MVLRSIFRVPMGVFDEYRALAFKYPRAFNFWYLYCMCAAVMFLGKGFEKLAVQSDQTNYEWRRRARRFFMPYSVVSYKWRFPEAPH